MGNLVDRLISAIGDSFAPILKLLVKQLFSQIVLPKFKEVDEQAFRTTLVSLYGPIDVYVEDLVETTATQLDDAVIEGLMEAIEDIAARENIELPQLDDD